MAFGLVNGFIDYLFTPFGTTTIYSTIYNLHTLQITTGSAKTFPACYLISRSLAMVYDSGNSSASHAQVLWHSHTLAANSFLHIQLYRTPEH
jgi:hypothetical protein